jgi:hypothetical protein
MSVWTRVQTKVLNENVDMGILEEALNDLELSLDKTVTRVENSYGHSSVTAGLKYKGRNIDMGIVVNSKKGITLAGDTYRSGIVGDNQADKLINMISQAYQKVKLTRDLELEGWTITSKNVDGKIVLDCIHL